MKFPLPINSVIFIFFICIFELIDLRSGQIKSDPCRTAYNTLGSCVLITECGHLQTHLRMVNRPAEITNYVINSQCGKEGRLPKVCCAMTDTLGITESTCVTPDNQEGTCKNVLNCDNAIKLLQRRRPVSNDIIDYLRQSRCDVGISGDEHRVCCPLPNITAPEYMRELPTTEPIVQPDLGSAIDVENLNDMLPKRCGIQPSISRLLGGNATGIDEYPWMALIRYRESTGSLRFACGGSLISKRYVLTAAHCISGTVLTLIGVPHEVRLGEYDLSKEKDCVKYSKDEVGEGDCALPVQDIIIESYVAHPMYNKTIPRENDIGLIRLQRDAEFTDFVKPICIPRSDVTAWAGFAANYTVAGWGRTENRLRSEIKLHLKVPYVDADTCEVAYEITKQQLSKNTQICAGGQLNRDTCQGDSGGPLMMLQPDKTWAVVGIISFGAEKCGAVGIPGVYTKVVSFLPWIGKNLKP